MIPISRPVIGEDEKSYIEACLQTGWIAAGRYITEFEKTWASYCGCKYGIAVTNGTHALELAVACFDFPDDSEIIMPSMTIFSCALAAIKNGLKPVLVDVNPFNWCIDVDKIEEAITDKTVAIMPVHIYGYPAQMSRILEIAKKHNLVVIEDAAEAHGAMCLMPEANTWQRCGSMGDVGCFSFYSNKIITTGEGGMVVTNSEKIAEIAQAKRNLCFGVDENRFLHTGIGSNFRMTNIQAAMGLGQCSRIADILAKKASLAAIYRNYLRSFPTYQLPPETSDATNIHWMFGLVSCDKNKPATYFISELKKRGIDSRPFFTGLHLQPALGLKKNSMFAFPVTDKLSKYGFCIPSGIDLVARELQTVITALVELA